MPLETRIALDLSAKLTKTGLAPATVPLLVPILLQLTNGTLAGQADLLYAKTRTLAASATEDLDLAGVVTDETAVPITFARVKALYVRAHPGNTNNVVVGAAAANAWASLFNTTGTLTLRPGSFMLAAAGVADATGYAVTGGTGDQLKVANSAGSTSVSYDIAVIGTSA